MTYVIHGATGAQGSPLRDRLIAAGHEVLGTRGGANLFDNTSVESLVNAYTGAEGVFIHLPMAPEPIRLQHAKNIVSAITTAKPKRVVVSTSGSIIDQPNSPLQAPEESAIATLIRGIERSGVSSAIVATRLYLENLLLPIVMDPVKNEGVLRYAIRTDYPVSWSSHRDVAEVAARLLADHSVEGVVGVGHLPGLQGQDLADGFAAQWRRKVVFEAITPEAFGALLRPMFGAAADAVVDLYKALAKVSANLIDERTSAQRLLGITPRSVQAWLAELQS